MKLLQTILAAVDFDDTCQHVLAGATTLAKQFGSEVVLMHAVEPGAHMAHAPEKLDAAVTARLEQMMKGLNDEGVSASRVLCQHGKAFVEIASAAENLDANLILVGARGIAGNHHFPLGTTTEKVMRRSAKPVLAVFPDRRLAFRNILCPVDFSEASARGLTNAIRLARAFNGRVHVVTVILPPTRYHRLDQVWAQWAITAEAQAAHQCVRDLNEFLERFDFRAVNWEKHIERGEPAGEIVELAKKTNADLIVMGSVGRTGLPYALLGSTAVKVARQLPCSLLTVHQEEVFIARVEQSITDINAAFQEGQELLAQGFCHEAITRFEQCLSIDPHFVHAIEAKAAALQQLGRTEQAEAFAKLAVMVQRELWDDKVTASVRAHHSFFARHGPY